MYGSLMLIAQIIKNILKGLFMDIFEYKGYWKLPNNERTYCGSISYSENGGILELMYDPHSDSISEDYNEIIIGCANNTDFTLINLSRKSISFRAATSIIRFKVETIIKGSHFNSISDININGFELSFDHINYWIKSDTYTTELRNSDEYKPFTLFKSKKEDLSIYEGCKLDIVLSNSCEPIPNSKRYEVSKYCCINFKYDNPIPFENFINDVKIMNDFYCFVTQEKAYPTIKKVKMVNIENEVLIYLSRRFSKVIKEKKINPEDFLIFYEDSESDFTVVLQLWFSEYSKWKSNLILYFCNFFSSNTLEFKFLSTIQILESFQRNNFEKITKEDPEIFKQRKETILQHLPPSKRLMFDHWLNDNTFNNASLRNRLEYLFRKFSVILSNFSDRETFISVVINTRNYMSHALTYSEIIKRKIKISKSSYELYNLYMKTKIIFDISLLHKLGFDDERIKSILYDFRPYRGIMSNSNYFSEYDI